MAMRRGTGAQGDLVATRAGDTAAPGHAIYDKFQKLLIEVGFDVFVEEGRKRYWTPWINAPFDR